MKKFLSIFLLVALTLAVVSVHATEPVDVKPIKEFDFPDYLGEADAFTLQNQTDQPINIQIDIYDQAEKRNVQALHLTLNPGDAPLPVKARVYKNLEKIDSINLYRYTIKADNGFKAELFYAQKLIGYDAEQHPLYRQIQNSRFRNNTASSFGPHLRDTTPEKTNLWYMYTPLDLTRQGRSTYELIGSNMYVIGEVYVDVNGDTVTVTYHNYYDGKGGNTETSKEFLGIYHSYQDVQVPADTPLKSYNNPPTNFRFGVPFSIQYDLQGDTRVIMLVRNVVDYWRFPKPENAELRRIWENSPENTALRNDMLRIMDPIE